ncbi:MAG: PspC domain-containing protein [Chitinophagales bacterium]|nr:PspC domain-containing protein [Chitinophagales bacterium]MDW8394074.1 PspC domain-containing protein [Chitinophagales bacterium]
MKKTVNINLSGQVFHIDEDAFDQLQQYLESLRAYFNGEAGRDEIIADIEARMAEMFSQRLGQSRQVITAGDVGEVIDVMGRPEQITGGDAEPTAREVTAGYRRRLFRNPDDRVIGGVCSGIGAYFGLDPVWLRLAFVIAVIVFGTGILLYLVLWIIMPEARTASDKLMMRGEPVTITSIEKSIKSELEALKKSGQAQARRFNASGNQTQAAADRILSFFTELIRGLGKFILAFLGAVFLFAAIVMLLVLMALMIAFFGQASSDLPLNVPQLLMPELNPWLMSLLVVLLIGIPAVFLVLLGLKLLLKININLNRALIISLVLWVAALGFSLYLSGEVYRSMRYHAENHETVTLNTAGNTLYLQAEDLWQEHDYSYSQNGKIVYRVFPFGSFEENTLPLVKVYLNRSETDSVSLNLTRSSRGRDLEHAMQNAQSIMYSYKISDSVLVLPNSFTLRERTAFRGQKLKVTLNVPDGWFIRFHSNVEHLWIEPDVWLAGNKDDLAGHTWQMRGSSLHCVDCTY